MSGKAITALDAVEKASITQMSQDDLEKILDKIIEQNYDEIKKDGMHSMSSIMGIVMKQVRGKTSGSLVNQLLKTKIKAIIK
jgi:glutamyl-tRNA(Gln) amidotransferase subunit E